jgi:hypothetical protein
VKQVDALASLDSDDDGGTERSHGEIQVLAFSAMLIVDLPGPRR